MRATDLLFEAAGGHALFLDNPIQRAWRDVHAMRAHAGNNPERAPFIFARSEFATKGPACPDRWRHWSIGDIVPAYFEQGGSDDQRAAP